MCLEYVIVESAADCFGRPIRQPGASVSAWLTGLPARSSRDRFGQIAAADLRALDSHAELIVDPAAITNRALGVEHEDLGRAHGAKLVGQFAICVEQDRELDLALLDVALHVFGRVLHVRDDPHHGHPLLRNLRGNLGQPRTVHPGQWAFGPQERDDDQFLIGESFHCRAWPR